MSPTASFPIDYRLFLCPTASFPIGYRLSAIPLPDGTRRRPDEMLNLHQPDGTRRIPD